MTGWVPLAVLLLGTSRQRPDAALTSVPDEGGVTWAAARCSGATADPVDHRPWPGTLALIAPLVVLVALVQASRRVNELPVLPIARRAW
jgi:hypothetical protein